MFTTRFYLALYVLKWVCLCLIVGVVVGSVSAGFLISFDFATNWQYTHSWGIFLLPVVGFGVGLLYHYYGKDVVLGNSLIIEEFHHHNKVLPFKIAPMIVLSTFLTHLAGGSAGRESTAIQMGSSLADQLTNSFNLSSDDRKLILIIGVSAGFSSVFGTPLSAAIFALEFLIVGKFFYKAIMPTFLVAIIANEVCLLFGIEHPHYYTSCIYETTLTTLLLAVVAGLCFGFTASFFVRVLDFMKKLVRSYIEYAPFRPIYGGVLLVVIFMIMRHYAPDYAGRYVGIGIHVIIESFQTPSSWIDSLAKLLITAITIGAGFKGGETTPLFFIGATLGSFLSLFLPLPIDLLAAMGFVAVFAGASNTPIACMIMGIELFGAGTGIFVAIACVMSFIVSGNVGIYPAQVLFQPKNDEFKP